MPQMILTGGQSGTLRRGLRDAFDNAYESQAESTKQNLEPVMALGLPSDTDKEFYSYFKHAPYPRYWPTGENVAKAGFAAVQFNVLNYDYGLEVEWRANDEDDNQNSTGVRDRASDTGRNFAYNPTLAFFDMLLGTANFLPAAIGNAPDGAAAFATTDGTGAARFGATSGNLLTGTGIASHVALRTDIWTAIEQFSLFQNTESKPLFPPTVLDSGYIVYFGAANEEVYTEAFLTNPQAFEAAGGTGNAGTQNSFIAGGKRFELRPTQHITTDDAYVFLKGAPHKPFFQQMRKPATEEPFDESNSKESARNRLRSLIWHERTGYGLFLPYGVIKIDN